MRIKFSVSVFLLLEFSIKSIILVAVEVLYVDVAFTFNIESLLIVPYNTKSFTVAFLGVDSPVNDEVSK